MQQIATAFVKAQKAFAPALKTASNSHFKTKYADLASCIEAVIDALNANGIALIQRTHESGNGVAIETLLVHESGESISGGVLNVPASKQDPQGYGSAMTYARRYSLMAACGIAPEDDDAEAAQKNFAPRPVPKAETRKAKSLEELSVMISECKTIATLNILWAGLTIQEQTLAKDMFTIRKKEVL